MTGRGRMLPRHPIGVVWRRGKSETRSAGRLCPDVGLRATVSGRRRHSPIRVEPIRVEPIRVEPISVEPISVEPISVQGRSASDQQSPGAE